MENSTLLLEMRHMQKSFPGVMALRDVSLSVRRGTVHALMGENGAGKSTLMKCLFGIYHEDSGEIFLEGTRVQFQNPREALSHGVAMVHQELNQALRRSIMDNIWLGRYPTRLGIFTSEKEMVKKTADVLENLGISLDPRRIMSTLSVASRQMVEIAKAVSYDAKIIVLDEPTSSLTESEIEHLFRIIDLLKKRGCGIIYISHKMEEILRISDDITVMRDGALIATEPAPNMTMEKIIRLMVGRELSQRFPPKTATQGEILLEAKNITSKHQRVLGVSLTARRGEIVGLAGLAGAGRSEFFENIFGISARAEGKLFVDGKPVQNKNARQARKNGFAFVTEERRATGIFGILSITENMTISSLSSFLFGKLFINDRKRAEKTDHFIKLLNIKTPSRKTQIRALSGGNQQKVIFGRWLLTDPDILLLDEPTRGIDVGAKYEIYQLIEDLAARGKAVLLISSELPELLGICHRIYVMSEGEITGEVNAATTTQEEIMRLASRE